METLENALALLLDRAVTVEGTEQLPLVQALGRIAAQDICSAISVPPFDRSPLDGYALHSEDIAGASRNNPVYLKVIGEACAGCGEVFHVGKGEALRLMTGAPVPAECDCVIKQEDTDLGSDRGCEKTAFYASVKHGANICRAGEDIARGTVIVHRGEKLTAAHLGVLSSTGVEKVQVVRPVQVALLNTGDEVTTPGQPLTYGKIYDSNGMTLRARLT